jgi:hypothetical protein
MKPPERAQEYYRASGGRGQRVLGFTGLKFEIIGPLRALFSTSI